MNAIVFLLEGQTSFSPRVETTDETGQQGDEHHGHNNDLDMLVDSRNIVAKEVANPQHTPHPKDGTEHIVRGKLAESHAAHAGDHGRKRADNRNELRYHDCRAAISFLKFVGADSMLLVEEQAVFPVEDPRTRGAADEITERIAQDCSEREDWSQLVYIQVSARGEQACGDKQGIAGQKKAYQESGFRKNNDR
ncbi:MAG TPA: hypothetical protein VN927_04780 [Gemmatimonadaceae bacterium]|nr:hypothetical protein [Gemmatimonadaceae bacterium]